jgi:hypothetical protein
VLACSGVVYYYITKSPKHRGDGQNRNLKEQETIMNTSTSTKLAALALALMVNSVIMGGIAYLFNAQLQGASAVTSLVSTAAPSANAA